MSEKEAKRQRQREKEEQIEAEAELQRMQEARRARVMNAKRAAEALWLEVIEDNGENYSAEARILAGHALTQSSVWANALVGLARVDRDLHSMDASLKVIRDGAAAHQAASTLVGLKP